MLQIETEVELAKAKQSEKGGEMDYSNLEALLREKLKKFAAFNASFSSVNISGNYCLNKGPVIAVVGDLEP